MSSCGKRKTEIGEQLLDQYDKLYRLAYSYVRSEQEAMDIVQESACKALSTADRLRSRDYISTWLYRIVTNTAIDVLRKRKREVPGIEAYLEGEDQNARRGYDNLEVMDLLSRLEDKDRAVVILRYFEDLKLEDIARVTGDNLNTVKTRLYRSLRKLKIEAAQDVSPKWKGKDD